MSGNDRELQPRTTAAPVTADPVAARPSQGPAGALAPLDTTQTVKLLLRDVAHDVETAVATKAPSRKALLIRAVGVVSTTFRLIDVTTNNRSADFIAIATEVAAAVLAVKHLEAALAAESLNGVKAELATQLPLLADLSLRAASAGDDTGTRVRRHEIDTMIRSGRTEVVVPGGIQSPIALTSTEHVMLFRQGIAGATAEIADVTRTTDFSAAKCIPIAVQLGAATDAAMGVTDKLQRRELTPEVTRVSQHLDGLAQLLSMAPAQPWSLAYAQTFDAENELLHALGLPRKARPYSGKIDPQQAISKLRETTNGKQGDDVSKRVATDPQTAVNLIGTKLRQLFEKQIEAAENAGGDLAEPPPPKERSGFDTVLDIAVGVALGGVAGAIGGAIAEKLKKSLEGAAKQTASDVARALGASQDARKELMDRLIRDGALHRAVAVDGAKDAAKALFKDTVGLALKGTKSHNANAGQPLRAFTQQQKHVLVDARQQAELQMIHLASALSHLDLDTLNELQLYMGNELKVAAYNKQYDSTIRAWQNFRAQLIAKELDPTSGKATMPNRRVDGVLEARFVIDPMTPLGHATPKSLVLRGGEPRAIAHLKQAKHPLDKVGVHTKYTAIFEPNSKASIALGVGPGFNLLDPGIVDLQQLKVIASNDPMLDVHAWSAMAGNYDHVSDAAALRVANQLIRNMAYISTTWLEE